MKITDLIKRLNEFKSEYGNLEVCSGHLPEPVEDIGVHEVNENDESICHLWYGEDFKTLIL